MGGKTMKIAIVGAGKLGSKLIAALSGSNHSIIVIDDRSEVLDKVSAFYDVMTIPGNGKQLSFLKENGIGTCDYLIACTDSDEANIVISSLAKSIGCNKVIARVRDPEYMNHMDSIKECFKIDYTVNPDLAITNEIYKYLVEKYTLTNGIFRSGKVALVQFKVKKYPSLEGLSMVEVSQVFPRMLVAALSRNGKIIVPHGDTRIEANDYVYLIGERSEISQVHKKVREKGKYTDLQKVMIIGGGKTGFYLASKLADFGISVKLIEKDRQRCYYLSTQLDDVMILCGDATDGTFLEEENIDGMDAVVTATGFDEENLLLALLAKNKGIEDVISKISHDGYKDLIESMGVDMALNPIEIITSMILQYIQGDKLVSSLLIQGQAEILEFIATKDMRIIGKTLETLSLPNGVLITAIHRGNQVIIPKGKDYIQVDDRVSVFCLLSDLSDLESLFTKKVLTHKKK